MMTSSTLGMGMGGVRYNLSPPSVKPPLAGTQTLHGAAVASRAGLEGGTVDACESVLMKATLFLASLSKIASSRRSSTVSNLAPAPGTFGADMLGAGKTTSVVASKQDRVRRRKWDLRRPRRPRRWRDDHESGRQRDQGGARQKDRRRRRSCGSCQPARRFSDVEATPKEARLTVYMRGVLGVVPRESTTVPLRSRVSRRLS
jgi:hypothetical protein